ncbi:MAG TPA: PIN domain-containing protein, partial [bacterium]|nr:PIN domain-containing protein [bacterium]
MNVILDSNIFIGDYTLKGNAFSALFNYLEKTKHKLLIFEIVKDEVTSNYKRELKEYLEKVEKLKNKFTARIKEEIDFQTSCEDFEKKFDEL